ncbi:uncharacterized protein PODANS_5_3070 [Podospora anserina S mat+]|uniref:Podospora anserina S mat+ genomic DNA chromosome 5, supercontig 1 n=1 Tax=Podospora anserina (strain S / ATCC MYA-4624 / DSM 980 / FGSC 10383) TaxID=515849 RepID=B2AEC2_PODAN|nr:uncharacterized protein PODANS_5_3070 [Podospora anserina S mat+]CAP61788.1 unnamed protein product [Podospora anserina S mat+]
MSNSGAWGEAPPGVNLAENQNGDIIGSVVGIMVLGLSSVVLRLFTRLINKGPGLAADDYVILFAAVMGIGTAVCCLISVPWGGGKHLWVVTHEEFTKLYQTTYAFVIVYITCISATKVSILLFYRRVFGTNVIWYIVFGFTCAHWAEVTITWLAGCRPIDYYWRQYTDPTATGSCIDAPLFYFCNGIIGLVIDVAILLVPIPTGMFPLFPLARLEAQHAHHQKGVCRRNPSPRRLVREFLSSPPPHAPVPATLRYPVCVASAIRIVMMDQLVKSPDFTWAMSKVFIWSCCEPFIGIVCACLPTYAPLVRRWWKGELSGYPDTPKVYMSDKPSPSKAGHKISGRKHHGGLDATLRGDDEIELTVDISGEPGHHLPGHQRQGDSRDSSKTCVNGKGSPEDSYQNEIMVRKDFSWSSSV